MQATETLSMIKVGKEILETDYIKDSRGTNFDSKKDNRQMQLNGWVAHRGRGQSQ